MSADPWECAKAFVKKALTNTGVMLFEKALEEVGKDDFLGRYFGPPVYFTDRRDSQAGRKAQGRRSRAPEKEKGSPKPRWRRRWASRQANLDDTSPARQNPNMSCSRTLPTPSGYPWTRYGHERGRSGKRNRTASCAATLSRNRRLVAQHLSEVRATHARLHDRHGGLRKGGPAVNPATGEPLVPHGD